MSTLYVIDRTSRMYGYKIPEEGLKVRIGGKDHIVTEDDYKLEEFENAIQELLTISVCDPSKSTSMYNTRHITGVTIQKNN